MKSIPCLQVRLITLLAAPAYYNTAKAGRGAGGGLPFRNFLLPRTAHAWPSVLSHAHIRSWGLDFHDSRSRKGHWLKKVGAEARVLRYGRASPDCEAAPSPLHYPVGTHPAANATSLRQRFEKRACLLGGAKSASSLEKELDEAKRWAGHDVRGSFWSPCPRGSGGRGGAGPPQPASGG